MGLGKADCFSLFSKFTLFITYPALCYSGSKEVVKITDLKVCQGKMIKRKCQKGWGKQVKIRVSHFRSHNSLIPHSLI